MSDLKDKISCVKSEIKVGEFSENLDEVKTAPKLAVANFSYKNNINSQILHWLKLNFRISLNLATFSLKTFYTTILEMATPIAVCKELKAFFLTNICLNIHSLF